MDGSRYRCSVISPDGVSRRVGRQGLLIGRDPACDIVVADPAISRHHALIRTSIDGVEINVHITRCRKDLLAAGLAGPRLLQRAPGDGATRLALAPGCTVEVL